MSDFGKFPNFKNFGDQTIGMANKGLFIEFEHVPTKHKTRFKSIITQFRDDFTSEYNTEFAYGRMDPIQTFKRTGRVLSFDFDIPSASMEEAFENLRRMSLLIQFLYPTYSEVDNATAIKAAPIVRVKFLNFIQSQLSEQGLYGTLSGITFTPDMESGVYEYVTGPRKIAPKIIKVSCQLTVLHDHALGWVNRKAQKGFRDYPYNVYPFYSNLKANEPNNVRSPKGASNNKNIQKAREGFMGPPQPGHTLSADDPKSTDRKPLQSIYTESDITPQDALVNNDIAEATTSTGDATRNINRNAGRFVIRGRGDQVSPAQKLEGLQGIGELPLSGETGRNRLPGKKGPTRPAKPINLGDGRGSGE